MGKLEAESWSFEVVWAHRFLGHHGRRSKEATIRDFRIVRIEGSREVTREIGHHSLDAILSVGYRVNSVQATQFRIWATETLREFKE